MAQQALWDATSPRRRTDDDPLHRKEIQPPDVTLADYVDTALSMIGNTAPFNVARHPACTVPTAVVNGLPAGLMIIGRHFADTTVLRVAHTYEQAVGGFPTPAAPGPQLTRRVRGNASVVIEDS